MGGSCAWSADASGPPPREAGLYVHVPFCHSLCPYCDFTIALSDPRAFAPLVGALRREWAERSRGLAPRTVYLGGGTPTELPADLLAGLLELFTAGASPLEVCVESNPESVTRAKLESLRAAGLTRLSVGVQSTDAALLRVLGRTHTASQARAAFQAAREAGVQSVNVDLMFGLPGQTSAAWAATLEEVLAWGPDHVSAYALELSPRVPLARRLASGALRALPDAATEALYRDLCGRMADAGFEHYEISNFCRPGHRSAHNEGYWLDLPYLGLGPGAHSFDGVVRSWNVRPHRRYVEQVESGSGAAEAGETPTPAQRRLERVFLALRTSRGLPPGALDAAAEGAARLWAGRQDAAHVAHGPEGVRFTEAGFWYSQALTADLAAALPPVPDGADAGRGPGGTQL